METNVKKAIKEYQCSGCISGHDPVESGCFKQCDTGCGCGAHHAGTFMMGIGKLFLGLPKGFNRLGDINDMHPYIFEDFLKDWGEYNKFNIPVWKHLDENGNTIVRGLQPRLNTPFIHIHLGDHRDKINCIEITNEDISEMD
jgi:hypothetical protein